MTLQLLAQGAGGEMTQEEMQKMMQGAMKMQECMSKMDPAVMQRMQEQVEKISTEVDTLCAAGKRDEAQEKAMAYAQSMATSRDMEQMRACGMMAQGMAPNKPMAQNTAGDSTPGNVCDNR
ncbi:MAG: hypothetical protein HW386_2550 [Gammaproteobacteria bacterium]|nr:hypothetical protein [Gammaproteobacteria bacterium]